MTPKFLAGLITVLTQNGYKAIASADQMVRGVADAVQCE